MIKKDCNFYPCHILKDDEKMTCDECYCHLYPCNDFTKGKSLKDGIWDCSDCTEVHSKKYKRKFFKQF